MIDVKNISKTFKSHSTEVKALVNVTAKVDKGEVVVVLGPSGSGKSTFIRCLNYLNVADEGSIVIDGIDILDPKTDINKVRAEVGMVFQSFNLFPHKTVLENVTLAPIVVRKNSKEEAKKKGMALLEKVGILDKADVYPDQLSGGQQQRVAVARAVVGDQPLILADEPTGNLDSVHGQEVMELLRSLNREGTTIVMVTHSPAHADYAHRTVNLFDGHVVTENTRAA